MSRAIPWVVAGLALLVAAWNAWSLSALSDRIEALERGSSAGAVTQARPARFGGREEAPIERVALERAAEAAGMDLAQADLDDPEVRERLMDVVREEREREGEARRAQFQDSMLAEVEAFAAEEGLDDSTTDRLVVEIERRVQTFGDLRRAARSGDASMFDVRRDMREQREVSREALVEILGEDHADALEDRLFGGGPPRGGPPPF